MVARTYDRLGGISGVQTNDSAPYSIRGVDRDRFQNFIFECDPTRPFSGKVLVEISQDDPSKMTRGPQGKLVPDKSDFTWSRIAVLEFLGERDDIFLEFEVEASHIRARCSGYNANAAVSSASGTSVGGTGAQQFTIDGTPVNVNATDDLATVQIAINGAAIPNISTTLDTTSQTLIIERTDGNAMVLVEVTGTPLEDLGVLRIDDGGTFTANAGGRIRQIKTMR